MKVIKRILLIVVLILLLIIVIQLIYWIKTILGMYYTNHLI